MRIIKSEVDKANEPGIYRDDSLGGFFLKVVRRAKGNLVKLYYVEGKYRGTGFGGKRESFKELLGVHGEITPDQARGLALGVLAKTRQGINLREKRAADKETAAAERRLKEVERERAEAEALKRSKTLGQALAQYLENHSRSKSLNTLRLYKYEIECHLEDWLSVPLVDITREMCEKRFLKLSDRSQSVANLTFMALSSIFTYVIELYPELITSNPVKVVNRHKKQLEPREECLSDFQLRSLWQALPGLADQTHRDYIMLLLLTGLRVKELAGLKWADVDITQGHWTARKTKNGRDQSLPFTKVAGEIFQRRFNSKLASDEYVFPRRTKDGDISGIDGVVEYLRTALGYHFRLHSLKKTIGTYGSLLVADYLLQRILNHHRTKDVSQNHYVILKDLEIIRPELQRIEDDLLARCQGKVVSFLAEAM